MSVSLPSTLTPVLQRLGPIADFLQSALLLLIRLYWGWSFFETGKGKLMNHAATAEFFASLNLPLPGLNAWIAGATECFGGLLLLVGFASRLISLPLIFTMIVAYATADQEALRALFSDPDQFTSAAPFLFLLACVLVLVFGPGRFSLDGFVAGKLRGSASAAPGATARAPVAH